MRTLLPSAVVAIAIFALPALAQQSRPSADELAKENKELKAYIEKLEKRLGELQQKPAPYTRVDPYRDYIVPPPATAPRLAPFPQSPMPYVAPQQPKEWWLRPFNPSRPQVPQQNSANVPPGAQRYRFNGADVYLIPLR